jgi:short-subunit dehydrogenase
VDLSEAELLPQRMRGIARSLSRLDAIVHAAGYFIGGSVLQEDRPAIEQMLQVNVHAPLTITRALLPLLERSRGTLVFINSSGVHRPQRITANYMACKHALRSLTDSLREELNPRGVRVTTIFPGRTATPMQQALHTVEGRPYHPETLLQPEDVAEAIANAIALAPSAELVDVLVRPMMSSVSSTPTAARAVRRPRRRGVKK